MKHRSSRPERSPHAAARAAGPKRPAAPKAGPLAAVLLVAGLLAPVGAPVVAPAVALPAVWEDASVIVIEAGDEEGLLRIETPGGSREVRFDLRAIRGEHGEFRVPIDPGDDRAGEVRIRGDRLEIEGERFVLGELDVDEVSEQRGRIVIRLANREASGGSALRARRTWVEVGGDLHVEEDDFVLGDVICLGGDILVDGEVRRNVIAVGGDVDVAPDARIHGSVAAIDGRASIDRDAHIRGEVYSTRETRRHGRSAEYDLDWDNEGLLDMEAYYNRVDGGWLGLRLTIADPDSLLPSFHALAGRAFLRGRWDYDLGVRQRFFEALPVTIGGRFFRKLATDDEWLAPREETSVLALLAAEDYGDYYLEEGGAGFVTLHPLRDHVLGASYRYTELSFLGHYPNLWHLFDAHKQFRPNFSSVPPESLTAGLDDFEATLGELRIWYQLDWRGDGSGFWGTDRLGDGRDVGRDDRHDDGRDDGRDDRRRDRGRHRHHDWRDDRYDAREWLHLLAVYQRAGDDLNGDLAYERYIAQLQRRQPLGQLGHLDLRVRYGGSGGDLPLFRKFYLGGSRTIRSLDEKSLMGEQMILGNVEYVPDMLTEDFRPYVFYDVGKTAGHDDDIFRDGDFRSSIGMGLRLGAEIRVMLAKSLDDSDADPNLWVTLGHPF